jgi:hypothetical protein
MFLLDRADRMQQKALAKKKDHRSFALVSGPSSGPTGFPQKEIL